ncbi:MAG TPA: sigma 54-interacting transcriptional regulator, partial [Thermoanaerobaculia bacterium]|nr:sigma 54-interacting transcriptional regulator [Thermoanaerobaculia bacterium]
ALAVVYRVRTGRRGEALALKVARHPGDADELARFRHEVRLLSETRHPHVIAVHDSGVLPGGRPFLTMELLSPRPVRDLLGEPRDWDRFAELAIQAASGLAHIHRQGIIHLDVKPGNLGLAGEDADPRLVLLDFGLARPGDGAGVGGAIRGTLAYAAPEVLVQDAYDHRADLYSLGLTLYELATGVLPTGGGDRAALAFHLADERPDPRRERPDMPESLAAVISRLIDRDPGRRFASAAQLLATLGGAAGRRIDPDELLGRGMLLSSRLIGRESALEVLRRSLADAGHGRGRVVVVSGDEGMGKSRLLRELRLWAAVEGARVGSGRSPSEGERPLTALIQAGAACGITLPLAPVALTGGGTADRRERFRLYRDIARRLGEEAEREGPLVLLVDDFHRGGEESAELVAFLATEVPRLPLLVVAAGEAMPRLASGVARAAEANDGGLTGTEPDDDPDDEADDAANRPLALVLEPFDRHDTTRLVDASLGTSGLPEVFYQRVHERSGGTPGRVPTLLRHLVDERVLRLRGGEWKPSLPALHRWAAAPANADAFDEQRLAHLGGAEREVLDAASVLEEPFPLGELAALLGVDPEPAYERLLPLVDEGHLERVREASRTGYAFTHRRLRETLYGSLAGPRRAELHRRRAADLERREAAEGSVVGPAGIAEHYWRAGERTAALPYLLAAADAAAAVYAYPEAARLSGRAMEAASEAGERAIAVTAAAAQAAALAGAGQSGRALARYEELLTGGLADGAGGPGGDGPGSAVFAARLHLAKGRLHRRLGDPASALAAFRTGRQALTSAPPGESAAVEVDLLAGEARALLEAGETDAALAAARRALARAGERGLEEQRAQLLDALAMLFYGRGEFRLAERLERRALAVARRLGASSEDLVLRLRNNLGNVRWKLGDHRAAEEAYRENLDHCRATHDPWGQARALNNLGILAATRGDWRAARGLLAEGLLITRRLGSPEQEAMARLNLGEVEEVLGNWPRARRHLERGLAVLGDAGPATRPALVARLASLARKRGETARAEELAGQALAAASAAEDSDLAAECHHLLGLAAGDREDLTTAGEHFARAVTLAEEAGTRQVLARIRLSQADLALRREDRPAALAAVVAARALLDELPDRLAAAEMLAVEARVAAAADDEEGAAQRFGDAVRELEDLGADYEAGRTLYQWGIRTWSPELAGERLQRALTTFDGLGAEAEARRTRGVLERISEHRGRGGLGDSVLYEVIKVVNSSLDLPEVLDRAMDLALEHLSAERGMIVLFDPLTRELETAVSRNLDGADEAGALSESVVRRVIEQGEPVVAVDALTDQRFAGAESIVARSIRSILCVPLTIRDRRAGAIYVDHTRSRHLFRQQDVDFLVAFADHSAVAIDKARLYGEQVASRRRLKEENEALRQEVLASHHLGSLIGRSRAIEELKRMLERVAQSDSTVLVRGESGTGKGLVARIIHSISARRSGPFVQFNCAALPETLVESELFGHEKGAFTGAGHLKPGRFELAHGGTIFLDEVGKISRSVQAKLLRVVEEKAFERVGGTKTLRSDSRIVAATNLDLEEAIVRQEFREDLYYRLNIIP